MLIIYAALSAIGAILLFIGWYQASGETVYNDQLPGVNIAIAGVIIAGAGAVLLLLAGRRAVGVRQVAVLGSVPALPARNAVRTGGSESLVSVGGLRYYHRDDCPLIQDRDLITCSRVEHETQGRTACGVCRP